MYYNSEALTAPAQKIRIARQTISETEAVASSATACINAKAANVAVDTAPTAQPPYARCIVATPGGTTDNVSAKQVTIYGTDINDTEISETLEAFETGQATARTSARAFKTISRVTCAAIGTGVTLSIGTTDKIGIPFTSKKVVEATLDGVIETTAPAITSNAELSKNNIDLNSSLNGKEVCIYYYL